MSFNFDLKAFTASARDMAPVYLAHLRTIVLFTAAAFLVAGKAAGKYYYENKETIHEDFRVFIEAVKTGTRIAVSETLQAGRDARRAYDTYVGYDRSWSRHHRAFAPIQRRLYAFRAGF